MTATWLESGAEYKRYSEGSMIWLSTNSQFLQRRLQLPPHADMTIKVAIVEGAPVQLGKAIVTAIQGYPGQLRAVVLTRPSSRSRHGWKSWT
jgi:hypothetical protein